MAARGEYRLHRLGDQVMFMTIFCRSQQLVARLTIEHIVRLTTRGTGQRQGAKVSPLFTQQQFRAGAKQYPAILQRDVEVKAGRVLGNQFFQQHAAVEVLFGGDVDQARQHHFIHTRRRRQGGGAGHHLFKR